MEVVLKLQIAALPWNLVWIVSVFEGLTVAILPYVTTLHADQPISKPPGSGLLLGYIGMLTAILVVNAFAGGASSGRVPGGPLRIHHPLLISAWGAVYLALIFLFQSVFDFFGENVLGIALRAACALAASTLIVLFLYRWSVVWQPALSVRYTLGSKSWRIVRTSIWTVVVFVSLYEAIALPIIEILREIEHYRFLAGLLLGSVSGAVATAIVIALYYFLSRSFPATRLYLVVESKA
jgi:hypothetical protein